MTIKRRSPVEVTLEMAVEVCRRLAEGEALTVICKTEGMPNVSTVYRHLRDDPEFRELYVIARQDQAHTLANEIPEISDAPRRRSLTPMVSFASTALECRP